MLKEFPQFKGEMSIVLNNLPKSDKQTLEEFRKFCMISASESKAKDMIRNILKFRLIIEKSFDTLKLKELREFLSILNHSTVSDYTKNDIRVHVKKFLRWKFKDWSLRFDDLNDCKTRKATNGEKINANTILKKDDIEKILKTEERYYWKTFFISLYESGLRPIELRTLKWKDINFDVDPDIKDLSEFNIFATKTKNARTVYVQQATAYLRKLKEDSGESVYVFPSPQNKNNAISKPSVTVWLKRLSKKALGREVFPYLLRHSRATELYNNAGIPDSVAQKFMGHKKDMKEVYTHLSNDDVKKAMGKSVYNMGDLPPEQKHALELEVGRLTKEINNIKSMLSKIMSKKYGKKIEVVSKSELKIN